MDLLEAIAYGSTTPEERDGRIYGLLYGAITDANDPKGLGRIRARVGSQSDSEQTDWLDPCWPGSIEALPLKGEPVYVAFVDGDPNRGVWWWHPTSKTNGRATEFMILGTTFVGMYNYLVDQFNQLRADFNSHVHTVPGTGTTCVNGSAWTGTATSAAPTATAATEGNKGQASDGSTVSNQSASQKVLSGKVKVR